MRFNSNSVTLNRGINLKLGISLPPILETYSVPISVWNDGIKRFNKELDIRSQVSEIVRGVKIDVLRINRNMGSIVLWVFAKQNDVELISSLKFTLYGKVIFENDITNDVKQINIEDLRVEDEFDGSQTSIFKEKKLTCLTT